MQKKLIVIGGGAAGFFCAINAAIKNPELNVTIIEKTSKLLSKVRVSGGGRCNVTHACFSIAEMIKKYPRGEKFLKQSFHHFFTTDTIDWFEQRKIKLKTEDDGRMFPESNSSETIINCLLQEANNAGIKILMNCEVIEVEKFEKEDEAEIEKNSLHNGFRLKCKNGDEFNTDFSCIACGGYHKKEQFSWLIKLGHTFELPVPSLFTFNIPHDPVVELMGITLKNVVVKINGTKHKQEGSLLITHWGFSGPAILRLSAFAARALSGLQYDFSISVNWLPSLNENLVLEKLKLLRNELASQKISNRNPFDLPQRFWKYLLQSCGINEEIRWADLPAKLQNLLAIQLCSQQFHVKGKTTFKEEFVTAGGIKLNEVNAITMESKIIPQLFFAGEILDVDGITGGFNFQYAWTSGWLAANEIASLSK
ncbi:MAG TPA: NAD(P)/FAD-dependent oxidoreductase [Chitinophagaceae bacterium]|nr:NAD(P)/FAD-dependent oxidoreductase [Chitinophagaceae bacterium]